MIALIKYRPIVPTNFTGKELTDKEPNINVMNCFVVNAQISDEVFNFITDGEYIIDATGLMFGFIFGKPVNPTKTVRERAEKYLFWESV